MSKKDFLNEINMMTHKGVYPSLRILLEEDEENKDDSSSTENNDAMGDDEAFNDDEGDAEVDAEAGATTGAGEQAGADAEVDADSGESEESAALEISRLSDVLDKYSKQKEIRGTPTEIEMTIESKKLKKNYFNLKNFTLVLENQEEIVKKLQDTLEDFEEKNGFSPDDIFQSEIQGKISDIDKIFSNAVEKIGHPDLSDPYVSILKDSLEKIRKLAPVESIEKMQKEFTERFVSALNSRKIKHTLPDSFDVKSIKPSKHNVATGAVKSG